MSNCNGDKVMEEVLAAVEKAIVFYWDSYTDMNIDGIFGLRIIEGQILLMLDFLRSKSPLEGGLQEVCVRLDEAHRQAKNMSESSLHFLEEMDKPYFESMNRVIQRPWTFARNYQRIEPTLKWKSTSSPIGGMNETLSDQCMNELLGGPTHKNCLISTVCVSALCWRGMDGYGILHQLLYTMLAEQRDCLGLLNSELSRLPGQLTVEKLQEEYCANTFFQTSQIVIMQNNTIKFPLQDLFLEQELVCTMLGYVEFLHNDWLHQIISWQMPSGCFGETDSNKGRHSRRVQRNSKTVSNSGVDFGQPARVNHFAQPTEHLPVRPMLQGKLESIGKNGVLTGVKPLINVVTMPAGLVPPKEFVGLNLNAQKSGFNDSKILRGIPVMEINPMDKERGKRGKHHIRLNRHGGILEQAVAEHNHEKERVGDTQMRMEENMGNQGFRRVGNFWKHFIPVTETGGGDNHPQIASDEDNFRINRQINRKLLYEKSLNDGCLAHLTAVAMGALSQYLRFLIFANSSGFDATKHLFGINYLTHPDKLLPSFPPTSYNVMKKIPSAFMKSSTNTKMHVWKDANEDKGRSDLVRQRGLHVDRLKNRRTSGLRNLVITTILPVDDKDRDYDAISNMDKTKKGQKSEADVYDGDDVNGVAIGMEHPTDKSHKDDLLLYSELRNAKREVVTAVTEVVNRPMVKASHMHSSGDSNFEAVSSISSTYAFVIVITAVILLVLYRSLRKHRIGIQHRHGRWK